MDLSKKVAIITGGASGIGACCVEEFLKNNIKAVIIADIGNGENFAQELNKKYGSGRALFVKTDVTDQASFENTFKTTIEHYNNVDILVNCAGLIDEVNWRKMYHVNLFGPVIGCELAIKYLPKYKSDAKTYIINIASVLGMIPYAAGTNYSASKHAIVGLTRCYGMNKTLAKQGICIMALCPGRTATPFDDCYDASKIVYTECIEEVTDNFVLQKPDVVGKSAIEILGKGKTGSVWVIDVGELFEKHLPTYETLRN
ncbi:15-hydroxyprostaglandin dehydrogenase [nad(+)] [Holotrichia oblita]|uniref:15-hydroxyprostaglandin dehydrogenase [nad(+)] n=1 Tax=Holotrichia oblita TaxID=644536 RepID=A0ACB9T205_HOLOL|nr:15-hydroxyprostaglandin dehydrogenase [nad(+)] [Holotrichia oblita]